MAKTGCHCGVGLWNGYGPGGVNWDIFPRWQAEEAIKLHPEYGITDVSDYIAEKYDNGEWPDLWLCRRCRRIQIWDQNDKYVCYRKDPFSREITTDELFRMEEWLAYSDWDLEDDRTVAEALIHPFRPHRYFLSPDKQKIYVLNTDLEEIEFVYQEEDKELENGLWRNEHGLYEHKYRLENGYKTFVGSFYLNGEEVKETFRNGYLSDAVYGAVIGDALGVPFEFKERGSFKCTGMVGYGTHNQPAGTWSDDSSLILATCKSIQENNRKIVIEDIRRKFKEWLFEGKFSPFGKVFDVGNATRTAIITGQSQDNEYSNGNGSLMRILPLAFIECSDDDVRRVSAITHGHWISTEACVIFINIFKDCLTGRGIGKGKWIEEVVHDLKLDSPFDRLCRIDELSEDEISSSGYVVSTLEAALWCVLTSDSYTKCLLKAVNLGNDTDTVAAVAGALGSLKFSFHELPDPWINEIKNNDLIQDCLF